MSYTVTDHMIDCLYNQEYDSFYCGIYGSEENSWDEALVAETSDEYEYDRDALRKALIKWEADNDEDGFAMLWIAPDGSWFTSTIEAYFYLSEDKNYENLLFNAFEAGGEAARWQNDTSKKEFKSWLKHTRTA